MTEGIVVSSRSCEPHSVRCPLYTTLLPRLKSMRQPQPPDSLTSLSLTYLPGMPLAETSEKSLGFLSRCHFKARQRSEEEKKKSKCMHSSSTVGSTDMSEITEVND